MAFDNGKTKKKWQKISKTGKIRKFYKKNMPKSVKTKKTSTLSTKSSSNFLLNAKGGSLSPEAEKT